MCMLAWPGLRHSGDTQRHTASSAMQQGAAAAASGTCSSEQTVAQGQVRKLRLLA